MFGTSRTLCSHRNKMSNRQGLDQGRDKEATSHSTALRQSGLCGRVAIQKPMKIKGIVPPAWSLSINSINSDRDRGNGQN